MPSALNQGKLEDQRWHLVRFIEQHTPQGSFNNRVTAVFDGHLDIFGGMQSSKIKIVFSKGESADDKIKKMVAQAVNTKNIVVVTDDRSIQYAVRALGAQTSGTEAFLGKAKKKAAVRRDVDPGSPVSRREEMKITSEVGDIWLKKARQKKAARREK